MAHHQARLEGFLCQYVNHEAGDIYFTHCFSGNNFGLKVEPEESKKFKRGKYYALSVGVSNIHPQHKEQ